MCVNGSVRDGNESIEAREILMNRNKKYRALSLFSGIGGFEVGMSSLGFQFLKTLELDSKCCDTMTKNFSDQVSESIYPTDITKVKPEEFFFGDVEYIVGGPPCQSFSAAGRRAGGVRGINDTRGSLFWYYCKYVRFFQPKAFVFENVRGILSSKSGEDFELICHSFREIGYSLFWRVLNAADYGVPQMRERLFLVGIRSDIGIEFRFPRPTHGPDSVRKRAYVTAGDAISDLFDASEVVPQYGGKYGHLLEQIPEGENYRFFTEEMGHSAPLFAWRSKFSGFLQKISRNEVCKTIVAYQGKYDGPFHWANRKCTVDELKRLQGFPDHFQIEQTYGEAVKQIGNSVCPPVAHNVGKAILAQIEGVKFDDLYLLESSEKLSFDKIKRQKSIASKQKIKVRYSDIKQSLLFENFDSTQPRASIENYLHKKKFDSYSIETGFNNRKLIIEIIEEGAKTGKASSTLELNFFGAVKNLIESAEVRVWTKRRNYQTIRLMWTELHDWIKANTSYESLQPLFGHFTEPYPKFSIKFKTKHKGAVEYFQCLAIDPELFNKVLPYSTISKRFKAPEEALRAMREYGFDIRRACK